jgi:hypothetical protein
MRACQALLIISKLGYPFAISAILSSNPHACTDLVPTSPLPTNNKVLTASTYWYYEGVFPRSKSLLAIFKRHNTLFSNQPLLTPSNSPLHAAKQKTNTLLKDRLEHQGKKTDLHDFND